MEGRGLTLQAQLGAVATTGILLPGSPCLSPAVGLGRTSPKCYLQILESGLDFNQILEEVCLFLFHLPSSKC